MRLAAVKYRFGWLRIDTYRAHLSPISQSKNCLGHHGEGDAIHRNSK